MTFTEFVQLYNAYKIYNQQQIPQVQQQIPQVQQQIPQVQQPIQQVQQPIQQPIQQVQQPIQQPTNADIMAALAAIQVPQVQGQQPQVATVDDIICKIAGITVPAENKKEGK